MLSTQDPAKDGIGWYVYCGNSPVVCHDFTGKYWEYIVEGDTVLTVWVEGTTITESTTATLGTASKFGLLGILTAFCLSIQGDTLKTPLPPGYEKDLETGIVRGPNGELPSVTDAWNEVNATKKAEKANKKAINKARKKAVREAWIKEREMVEQTGNGTRDWSPEEKEELLKKGKVKGYQGHHINNVKDHPEMAGDSNNIEFLKPDEHLDAHNGNFKNKTEGTLLDRSLE